MKYFNSDKREKKSRVKEMDAKRELASTGDGSEREGEVRDKEHVSRGKG